LTAHHSREEEDRWPLPLLTASPGNQLSEVNGVSSDLNKTSKEEENSFWDEDYTSAPPLACSFLTTEEREDEKKKKKLKFMSLSDADVFVLNRVSVK